MVNCPTFEDLPIQGKKVLLRVDLNVPIDKNGQITDDTRIQASLPTIKAILERGGKLILMSHLGRPEGKKDPKYSLKPVGQALEKLLKIPVQMAPDVVGKEVEELVHSLKPGEVLLLENLRFYPGEEAPATDPSFAKQLAKLGDVYINDAFGTAHRAHASTYEVPSLFAGKRGIGLLMKRELEFLGKVFHNPPHPFVALIGGAKISTKIGLLQALAQKVDTLLIGGAMAYTFLKAQGVEIGDSLCDEHDIDQVRKLLDLKEKLILPIDHVVRKGNEIKVVSNQEGIPQGWQGVDIGPKTAALFEKHLEKGHLIFWNGPVGVFEESPFNKGTEALARAVTNSQAITVVGGGDSIAALQKLGLANQITHLSTGGGASLEFLESGTLPGVEALIK